MVIFSSIGKKRLNYAIINVIPPQHYLSRNRVWCEHNSNP